MSHLFVKFATGIDLHMADLIVEQQSRQPCLPSTCRVCRTTYKCDYAVNLGVRNQITICDGLLQFKSLCNLVLKSILMGDSITSTYCYVGQALLCLV